MTIINILTCYSRSPVEEKDETHTLQSAPEIRDVFGDSDEEEPAEYTVQNKFEEDSTVCVRFQKHNI